MTQEQNIKAILETIFTGFKEELIELAVEKIMALPIDRSKLENCYKTPCVFPHEGNGKVAYWQNYDPEKYVHVNGFGVVNIITGDFLPDICEIDKVRFEIYCKANGLKLEETAYNSKNLNNMEDWYLWLAGQQIAQTECMKQ